MVITGHGSFAKGMYDAIKLIAGEQKHLQTVAFYDNETQLKQSLQESISMVDSGEGVIVFSDLAGGTPFNTSVSIASHEQTSSEVYVIGGTNLPMLLNGMFQRETSIGPLLDNLIQEAKEHVKVYSEKQQEEPEEKTDGI